MGDYKIFPLTFSDHPTLANFFWLSKKPTVLNKVTWKNWPTEVVQRAEYKIAVQAQFSGGNTRGWKVVNTRWEMVGHVTMTKLAPSGGSVDREIFEGEEFIPEGMQPEVYKTVMDDREKMWEDWENKTFLELSHIFVLPEHRRKVIGKELVKSCIKIAEKQKLPLTVSSEPQVHSFFEKLGFQDYRACEWELSKWASEENSEIGSFRFSGMVSEGRG